MEDIREEYETYSPRGEKGSLHKLCGGLEEIETKRGAGRGGWQSTGRRRYISTISEEREEVTRPGTTASVTKEKRGGGEGNLGERKGVHVLGQKRELHGRSQREEIEGGRKLEEPRDSFWGERATPQSEGKVSQLSEQGKKGLTTCPGKARKKKDLFPGREEPITNVEARGSSTSLKGGGKKNNGAKLGGRLWGNSLIELSGKRSVSGRCKGAQHFDEGRKGWIESSLASRLTGSKKGVEPNQSR